MTDDPVADYHRYQTRLDLFDDEEELDDEKPIFSLGLWEQDEVEEEQEPCF